MSRRSAICTGLALFASLSAATTAAALGPVPPPSPARDVVPANLRRQAPPPLKDCTRWNGRSGFYGNIFCSEREQEAWDRRGRRRTRS